MIKERIAINNCKVGDIIAEDIRNNQGIVLVVENTILNEFILNKLINLGIEWISIYVRKLNDRKEELTVFHIIKDYENCIDYLKDIINKLTAGVEIEYDMVLNSFHILYEYIDHVELIVECLNRVKNHDEYTFSHSLNVGLYSMLIAKWLRIPEEHVKNILIAGLLHDIGKSKIPLSILNKNGKLTTYEYEIIKTHTVLGYELAKNIKQIPNEVKDTILMHHVREDNTGYPNHRVKKKLNLYAKIVSIADVYDAITSRRVYKEKETPFEAFKMFLTTGTYQFDTKILQTFLTNMSVNYIGSKVMLCDGNIGEIVYIPPQNIIDPIVQIDCNFHDLAICDFYITELLV